MKILSIIGAVLFGLISINGVVNVVTLLSGESRNFFQPLDLLYIAGHIFLCIFFIELARRQKSK
jgi:uncharacterized membrane protein YuzA (DUF378 family)